MVSLNREIWNPLDTTAGVQPEGDKAQTKLCSYHKTLVDVINKKLMYSKYTLDADWKSKDLGVI